MLVDNKNKKGQNKTIKNALKLIFLLMTSIYYLFTLLCFAALFALFTILVGDLIVGEVNQFYDFLSWILLSLFVLLVLFIINRTSVIKVFEHIAFGKFRGIPIGMVIIGLFLYTILDSFLLLLFNIHSNPFLKAINLIICIIVSAPLYGFLSFWYFEKKNK